MHKKTQQRKRETESTKPERHDRRRREGVGMERKRQNGERGRRRGLLGQGGQV